MKGNIFIKRPVMAISISVLILAIGLISLFTLPVEQYPDIAPPTVYVAASYTGADAEAVMNSVIMPLEESINGVEDMMYITSSASNAGLAIIQVYFKQGTDPDMAAVNVQNRVAKAQGLLPAEVTKVGVSTMKRQTSFLQIGAMVCTDGRYDQTFLANYLDINVIPQIKRIEGVGDVMELGDTYSMRIWLKPERMAQYGLVPSDITGVLGEQNIEAPTGSLGESSQNVFQFTMKYRGRLKSVEEFQNTVVRSREDGSILRLKDVADVELGTMTYSFRSEMDSQPAVLYMIFQTAGSNATAVNKEITAQMERMEKNLPGGTEFVTMMSSNDFLFASIHNVVETLIIAIILVILVVYFFLQDLKSTLIPSISIIVSLVGTFACLVAAGFSLNILTLFALVLAIGTVVDDAIVVVENVERIMMEEGLDARRATVKAMKQIGGAIVGITAVLVAVFVPMAFFSGAVGNIYRQFAVTLIVSISFSAFLALSLTPALCAAMLKPSSVEHQEKKGFFGWFNRTIHRSTDRYGRAVSGMIRRPVRSLFLYALIIAGAGYLYLTLPTSFLPEEDQGNFMAMVSLPAGTLQKETSVRLREVEDYLMRHEPVEHVYSVGGFSFMGSGTNMAMLFVGLKNWDERPGENSAVQAIIDRVNARFAGDGQMMVMALNMPALPELGNSSGFDFRLQDKGGLGYARMAEARDELLARANANPNLAGVYFSGQADTPRLHVSIDREKAFSMGVPIAEISNSLAVMFGSSYVGDFMHDSQVRRIMVQADGKSRLNGNDIEDLHVRNDQGKLLPLSSFVRLDWTAGPPQLTRYNNYPSFTINGSSAPGKSSGDAMNALEQITASLPQGVGFEWTGQSYEEKLAGSQATLLFGLSILIVFLVLAALYESWSIPLAVILVVPLGLLGALLAVFLRDMPNDIYFKVGLITTIGLSAKNAILIVEVAREFYREGMNAAEAAVAAAKLRLRPILMTSLAFGAGVIPLAFAHGAAAGAQRAVGTGVLGGIITATLLAIFLVPLFFRLTAGKRGPDHPEGI